jgi:Ran GTPase-activating protein (RanGAP) involved in mRNA processing and transport
MPLLLQNREFLYLDFSLNQIGNEGGGVIGSFLEQNPPVIYLHLGSNSIEERGCVSLFQSLCVNHHLTTLDMGTIDGINRNRMSTQGCQALGSMLLSNQTLANLNLSMCGVSAAGCSAIGKVLSFNTSLASFDLSANRFGTAGALALFQKDHSMGSIHTLLLARNAIGDEAGPLICKQMEQSKTLKSLDLSENGFGKSFCQSLLETIQIGITVRRISLARNQFTPACGYYLRAFIVQHHLLVSLDLSGNPLKDKGLLKIAEAMKTNTNVQTLDVSNTEMTDVSGVAFAEVIRVNTSLQRLYLEQGTLTDISGVLIAGALETNITLASLSLADNELKDVTADAILKAFQINTTLSHLNVNCNDFGCHAYVQLTKTIEQKQRLLAANVEEVAQRHINWLKEEEMRLFQIRGKIRQLTADVAAATEVSEASSESLKQMEVDKKTEMENARITIEELDERIVEVESLRRHKMIAFKEKRREIGRAHV